MHIIWIVLVGFVVGLLARAILPGRQSTGFFLTAALGIGGALFAACVGEALHWYAAGQGASFIASVVGALVLLEIYGLVAGWR